MHNIMYISVQVRYSHSFIAAQLETFRIRSACVQVQLSVSASSRLFFASRRTGLHGIIITLVQSRTVNSTAVY